MRMGDTRAMLAALAEALRSPAPPREGNSLLRFLGKSNWAMLANASTLVSTTAITSALGFLYWWITARLFSTDSVGLASAAISAMALLGTVGSMGLGTLLIGELPRRPLAATSLITTALVVSGTVGMALGTAFALGAGYISPDLKPLSRNLEVMLLFGVGVGLNAVVTVLDAATIGLLRGSLQLSRNTLFAVIKAAAILGAGILVADRDAMTIYGTWVIGDTLSLVCIAAIASRAGAFSHRCRPSLELVRGLGGAALGHHALNLALMAPGLLLPMLVTTRLSASMNASFYVAWMIAHLAFMVPSALGTALYAVGSGEMAVLARRIRFNLRLGAAMAALTVVALLIVAGPVLSLFGSAYAEQAGVSLVILGAAVLPLMIRSSYVTICRLHGRILRASLFIAMGGLLELLMATIGAEAGSLTGLSAGWLLAVCIEALLLTQTVYRVARTRDEPAITAATYHHSERRERQFQSKTVVDKKQHVNEDSNGIL